jgi:cytoskeletal protein RodZ
MLYLNLLPSMSETIGQQLRQAREARQLSLEQASRALHIRLHYLQAIEEGKLEAMPSEVQARGFLRAYASYLGLDGGALLSSLQAESDGAAPPATRADLPQVSQTDETPSQGGEPTQAGGQIFADLGQTLKSRRELLGFSLEEVERHTHLRTYYLQALESGDLAGLPSPVQGRGMLNNYADFLGLDPEPLLLRFAEGLQAGLYARQAEKQATRPASRPPPVRRTSRSRSSLRRFFSFELVIAAVIVAFLAVGMIWAAVRIFALQSSPEFEPTAPSIAEVLLATSTATQTPTELPPTATIPVLSPQDTVLPAGTPDPADGTLPASSGGLQVYVTVRHRVWLRALVDGEIEFEGRVLPGSAYAFTGEEGVEILTSDGSAIQVFFNQQDLGSVGLASQVVHLVFAPDGVQTPTPTITVTPSVTPRVSPTPTYIVIP